MRRKDHPNLKAVNLFFPYFNCNDPARQAEIDLCLRQNLENPLIDSLILLIDDNSTPEVTSPKLRTIHLSTRPTYKIWVNLTKELNLGGVSLLANSDIYFDHTLTMLDDVFSASRTFLCLSRWDKAGDHEIPHPNPHWSQDVWGFNCDDTFNPEFLTTLDFEMGVPRCDNKVAYLFSVRGWRLSNPFIHVKSVHVHETGLRRYDKNLDTRILGGVAYVHPCDDIADEAEVEIDVWTTKSSAIKSVSLNKTLEQWIYEAKYGKDALSQDAHQIENASSREVIKALKNGSSVYKNGYQFEVLKDGHFYIFKNNHELTKLKKISFNRLGKSSNKIDSILAPGFVPAVITSHTVQIGLQGKGNDDLNFWQYPCATEKQAFDNHMNIPVERFIDYDNKVVNTYLPLPWATYIDKSDYPESLFKSIGDLLNEYKNFCDVSGFQLKVHSVCQHIHWRRIVGKVHELGVTDLHLSHKYSQSVKISKNRARDMRLHSWPLIAVNYVSPGRNTNMQRLPVAKKRFLASFIGAHMSHYRDESRVQLLDAARAYAKGSVVVELGEEWHYNKVVYEEQVQNKTVDRHHILSDIEKTGRYNKILSDSVFSLCPEGAGPNTLRLWESLAVGSIPVIFSDDVAIFRESEFSDRLLSGIIHWKKPIDKGLFEYLENMDKTEIEDRRKRLLALYPNFENYSIFNSTSSIDTAEHTTRALTNVDISS